MGTDVMGTSAKIKVAEAVNLKNLRPFLAATTDLVNKRTEYSVFIGGGLDMERGRAFLSPMGFEITFEPNVKEIFQNEHLNETTSGADFIVKKCKQGEKKLKELGVKCYVPSDHLEINTPIFLYENDVILFYELVKDVLGKDFVPRWKCSTGGGLHINVSQRIYPNGYTIGPKPSTVMPETATMLRVNNDHFVRKMIIYAYENPYLAVAWQDPDDWNTSDPISWEFRRSQIQEVKTNGFYCVRLVKHDSIPHLQEFNPIELDKSHMLTVRAADKDGAGRVELRFFDTVDDSNDLVKYIRVADHFVKEAISRPMKRPIKRFSGSLIDYFKTTEPFESLHKFCEGANLPYQPEKMQAWVERKLTEPQDTRRSAKYE